MQLIPAKTPKFVKSLFPRFIWNIKTKRKDLYLTFDDGPTPEITDWVLETLDGYKAKATFFCIGANVKEHPETFKKILGKGHTIGNHTHNHLKGWKHKTKAYLEDIDIAKKTIDANLNSIENATNLFRPPYGKLKYKQAKSLQKLGYKIVLWDVLSFDWEASVPEERCLSNVISSSKEGSVIVFHDSLKASKNLKYVLPKVLAHFSEKGFRFKSLN